MDNERNNRIQKVEDFLLDPERVLFESIEDFKQGIDDLKSMLAGVNLAELQQLQGADGVTPERGVDYFSDDDLEAIQEFILDRVPRLGIEVPSVDQVNNYIVEAIATVPRIEGPRGPRGYDGEDGKNGSPDTAEEIVEKLRSLPRNQRLKITDIRGLQNRMVELAEARESIDILTARLDNFKFTVNNNVGEGGGGGGSGTVTSVALAVPTGFQVSGSPITTNGTFTVTYASGYKGYTTTEASKLAGIEAGADVTDATNVAAALTAMGLTASITELNYVDGVTSAIQTQLDNKQPLDQMLTDIAALTDPGADRIMFWDDSAGVITWLTASTGLTISSTSITVRDASSTQTGIIEIATDAETVTGSSTTLATTPANLVAKMAAPGAIGGTTPSPAQFTTVTTTGNIELGNASDTTLSRSAAGQLAVEGVDVLTTSNTKTVTNKTISVDDNTISGIAASSFVLSNGSGNIDGSASQKAIPSGGVVGTTDAQTVTSKRMQPRTASSTTASTLTPDLSSANIYFRTTQTATLTIDAPTGTPVIGETIMIYVDSAGAQTLTINSTYKAFGAAFPATTTAGKTFMMSAQYNGTDWKTLWANAV